MSASQSTGQLGASLNADNAEGAVSNSNSQDSLQNSQKRATPTAIFRRFDSGTDSDQVTPSSSYSTYSSQENVVSGGNGEIQSARETHPPPNGGSSTSGDVATDVIHTEQASGLKRTATGQIKSPSHRSLPPSPVGSSINGHSRNTSTMSRGNRIAEMSSKLHTRLSYAKVKVDRGWEGHNINELERMTSAQASPVSASSYTARNTPPSVYSPVGYSPSSQLPRESSTSVPLQYHHPTIQAQTESRDAGQPLRSLTTPRTAEMLIPQRNETYEQFWQSHSNPAMSSVHTSGAQALNGRSLAPPVDFSPHKHSKNKQSTPPVASNRFLEQVPSTPPRTSTLAKRRTSNEQDALEGLLSMNSPANSQTRSTARPLRENPLHGNATEPSFLLNGIVNGSYASLKDSAQNTRSLAVLNDDELNNMLDNMPDSSSDEDVVVQRRLPPGEVLGS